MLRKWLACDRFRWLPHTAGVAIYNYHKLQLIRAKAALSTSKDTEKGGPGGASPGQIASAASLSHSDSGGVGANGRKDGYDSSYR